MAIERERIEAIKRDVDLAALVRAKGIERKKNGKSYFGLCPFHDDTNSSLSINPTKNLWQCFGCGAAGDVIRFVELIDKVTFPEAVSQLMADSSQLVVKSKPSGRRTKPASGQTGLTVKDRKLLGRVVSYYQHTFTQDSRGINYLTNDRGITDNQSLKDFAVTKTKGSSLHS